MARTVKFQVRCDTKWGEVAGVVGSCPALGAWDKASPLVLNTDAACYPVWTGEAQCPVGEVQYKLVRVVNGSVKTWEDRLSNNRLLQIDPSDSDQPINAQITYGDREQRPAHTRRASALPSNVQCDQLDDEFAKAIIRQNAVNRSWRTRLQFVRSLFTSNEAASQAAFDSTKKQHLVYLVVYLTFLKSGQIVCAEDGGHYRPNHHAKEAQLIEEALGKISNDSNAFLIRKIYPLLPSYKSDFTASVPLTRIRDIAHRGDIPHDMKQRIKHNLQNPLHRCASPEHMVITEDILAEITSPGASYSGAFVDQFRIFHRELLEFFNATSLDDQLVDIKNRGEPTTDVTGKISEFLRRKHAKDKASCQLEALLAVRQEFALHLGKLQGEVLQRIRLCDIALEDFAFVLLGGIAKEVEDGGQNFDRSTPGALLATKILMLSGVSSAEMKCCANELSRLSSLGKPDLLAMRSNWERLTRFCSTFSSTVSTLYEQHVVQLGQSLGVDSNSIQVFAEAEIRSHIVFHLSTIATHGLKVTRQLLKLPPWDPLWTGKALGRLVQYNSLEDARGNEDCVALLEKAVGDEDIPGHIRGIVLAHDLPHLSHLGVRARQSNVVFVCAQGGEIFRAFQDKVSKLENEQVQLAVDASGKVEIEASSSKVPVEGVAETKISGTGIQISDCDLDVNVLIPVVEASIRSCGSKAYYAGELEKAALASSGKAAFLSPGGAAVPFGCFWQALDAHKSRYLQLLGGFNEAKAGEEQDEQLAKLRCIFEDVTVPESVVEAVAAAFPSDTALMVRSSANCEDLENMSGAGLYDSISNVPSRSAKSLSDAIRDVWRSVWTKRAAQSRKQYSVPHEQALMSCLVQPMRNAEFSFIMFSQNPVSRNTKEVYMELAVGMGETLASASSQGVPYRASYNRETRKVVCVSLSSYSSCLVPDGGEVGGQGLKEEYVDYSRVELTVKTEYREEICSRLGAVAVLLEERLGSAQDIEGVVAKDEVHIVQTRAMVLGN